MTRRGLEMQFVDLERDPWRLADGEDGERDRIDPRPHRLLDLAQWRTVRGLWPSDIPVGVALPNDADISELAVDFDGCSPLALVALPFPKWTDGRAYSQARLLRVRHRFAGELRATGQVLVDMLPLLWRCGFDAVELRRDQSIDEARRALHRISRHYQADVHRSGPAFAREPAGEFAGASTRRVELDAVGIL